MVRSIEGGRTSQKTIIPVSRGRMARRELVELAREKRNKDGKDSRREKKRKEVGASKSNKN
eukprot:763778-Hanusia_phi.AAC.8